MDIYFCPFLIFQKKNGDKNKKVYIIYMPRKLGSNKYLNNIKMKNKSVTKYLDELNGVKYLHQRDFDEGTYRITTSGSYKLYENIVFRPNFNNGYKPKNSQINKYPRGAYVLGFFAVITIEVSNVKLDLNGYEICVSEEFNQHQRFASIIECGNSPFNTKQGPANFGTLNNAPNNIAIFNGKIGKSPHHGIRGNNNEKLVLKNLMFEDFEVAAISLHGCKDVLIENTKIDGVNRNVHSLSQYSQSLFILPFLKMIIEKDKNYRFDNKTVQTVYNNLIQEIDKFKHHIFYNKPYDGFFKNKNGLPDGNVYGILLHVKGVAVGEMLEERNELTLGNENIIIRNVTINNIESQSIQIKGLKNEETKKSLEKSYIGNFYTGPVGDVLKINKIMDDKNIYKGNYLSDAQLLIAKRYNEHTNEKYGSINIPDKIIEWAETKNKFENLNMISNHDSMGHFMKGNHGILISCGKNIYLSNIKIDNVVNYGEDDTRFSLDPFKHLLKEGHVLKEHMIVRGNKNIGTKSRHNEFGQSLIVRKYKEMENNEINPAIGKILIDDEYVGINNKPIYTSLEFGKEVVSKERGDELWLVVMRNLENDTDKSSNAKLSSGICITGCEKIYGTSIEIKNIDSKYGEQYKILKKNINNDIYI